MATAKTTARAKRRPRRSAAVPKSGLWQLVKAVLIATVITILCMLAFALLLKNGIFTVDTVSVANQVLKVLGIALAAWLCVHRGAAHPWFRGLAAGVGYILLGIIVFSVFVGSVSFSASNLLDIAMGAAIGAAVGLLKK